NAAAQRVGRFLPHVMVLLLLTVLSMVLTRQVYRDKAMGPGAGQALAQAISSMEPDDPPDIRAMPRRQLYIPQCNACHFSKQMAPPLTEIYALHRNDVNAIVQWAVQPGTKRAQYGPMPSQKHLGKTRLTEIAQYMLASGEHQAQAHPQ